MIDALPLLLGPEGYQISRSVRLRSSASAYFNRTPASAGNRKTFTMNYWLKRGELGTRQVLASAGTGANAGHAIELQADNTLTIYANNAGAAITLTTSQVFRDPSAYGMLTIAFDTTQATASNRVKLYWNGSQITAFSTATYPSQNADLEFNNNVPQNIGRREIGTTFYFDGYLTEINFIDGLTPNTTTRTVGGVTQTVLTELGEFDAVTGVWKPARWTRSFGTNGFYLNFSDPSAATAAAIGKDYSGNGNNWTPNNISVTAGATYDSMLDVPTPWADGGNGRGNYAVMNPLSGFTSMTLSDGNLRATPTLNTGWHSRSGSMAVSSGKWYAEFSMQSITSGSVGNPAGVGILPANTEFTAVNQLIGDTNRGYAFYCPDTTGSAPVRRVSGSNTNIGTGNATSTTDVFMVAFDLTSGTGWFGKNGTWYAGDPAAGTGASITGIVAADYVFGVSVYRDNTFTNNTVALNFGQRPFAYTPPSGFRALNTQNLPTPTILKGNQFFDATTYTGTGAARSVTNSGAMQPDLVWLKRRNSAANNGLVDSVRGIDKFIYSDLTNAEATVSPNDAVTSLNANGFSLGANLNAGAPFINSNGDTFVAWQWKEGATQGFDIVTYTGNGVVGRTVAHSLGVAPAMFIIKDRTSVSSWVVYHRSLGNTGGLYLNDTSAFTVSSAFWNNTNPTSSNFAVSNNIANNQNNDNYVAYLFAEVAGFSRFGSYTGNGSADGPFVFCGFRPRWVMIKQINSAESWYMFDTARDTHNDVDLWLLANATNAETSFSFGDFVANGFKVRASTASYNASGGTYIFAAFAENPLKYSLAR